MAAATDRETAKVPCSCAACSPGCKEPLGFFESVQAYVYYGLCQIESPGVELGLKEALQSRAAANLFEEVRDAVWAAASECPGPATSLGPRGTVKST